MQRSGWLLLLGVLVSIIAPFTSYFLNYLTLPFVIIIFLLILTSSINLYFLSNLDGRINNLNGRMNKVEDATRRNSLVLHVIVNSFINLQKLSRTENVTIAKMIDALSRAIEEVLGVITKDYFTTHHSSGIRPAIEQTKQQLLQKAHMRQISLEEGQELERLLRDQKSQHQASGDIGGAILAGLLLLFVTATLAALFGDKRD